MLSASKNVLCLYLYAKTYKFFLMYIIDSSKYKKTLWLCYLQKLGPIFKRDEQGSRF